MGTAVAAFAAVVPVVLTMVGLQVAAGFWLCGLAVGYVVQRSRLCFVGAIRDVALWRMPALARAVLVLLGVSLLGVAGAQLCAGAGGNVFPVGWHTVVGGLLFGLGMGLAGACALTTLVRLGEGAVVYGLGVGGLVVGGLAGLRLRPWWVAHLGPGSAVFLPRVLGWPASLLLELAVLATLWVIVGARGRARLPLGARARARLPVGASGTGISASGGGQGEGGGDGYSLPGPGA